MSHKFCRRVRVQTKANDNKLHKINIPPVKIIAFDEVERKPNFNLWLSRSGCSVHGYILK